MLHLPRLTDRLYAGLPAWTPVRTYTSVALSAIAAAALLALGGCATPGPARTPLALTTPESAGLPASSAPAAAIATQDWWRALGDAQLSQLIEQGLQDHPSLAAVQARVQRGLALSQLTQAANGPQAQLSLGVTRERLTEHGIYPAPLAGNVWNLADGQIGLGWEPDFFGKHQAELAAAIGQTRAAVADAAAARNALASQIARSYISLARLLAQRELAEQGLQRQQALHTLTLERVKAGLDTSLEKTQSEGTLPDAQSQIEQIDEALALARHQLSALSLQPDARIAALQPRLNALQPLPLPDHLGADLLGARPDVVAARWRVEAAGQDVASAKTLFYPNISLTAFVGLSSIGVDNFTKLGSRQFGAGPALHLPLFDGGRLRANLGGKQADLDAAIAQYNNTVLDAVRESRDALSTWQSLQRQQAQQGAVLASSEKALAIAQERDRAGLGNALVPLNAQGAVLMQRRLAADLQARLLDTQVQLLKALGAGWQDDTARIQADAGRNPELSR